MGLLSFQVVNLARSLRWVLLTFACCMVGESDAAAELGRRPLAVGLSSPGVELRDRGLAAETSMSDVHVSPLLRRCELGSSFGNTSVDELNCAPVRELIGVSYSFTESEGAEGTPPPSAVFAALRAVQSAVSAVKIPEYGEWITVTKPAAHSVKADRASSTQLGEQLQQESGPPMILVPQVLVKARRSMTVRPVAPAASGAASEQWDSEARSPTTAATGQAMSVDLELAAVALSLAAQGACHAEESGGQRRCWRRPEADAIRGKEQGENVLRELRPVSFQLHEARGARYLATMPPATPRPRSELVTSLRFFRT